MSAPMRAESELIALEGGVLDLPRREIRRSGEVVRLTTTEHRLLSYLVARPEQLVTTRDLLVEVWGYHATCRTRAVSHAILRLRRKLELDPSQPVHLHTEYGEGYRWSAAPTPLELVPEVVELPEPAPRGAGLPHERDAFIGRAGALEDLGARLASGARLVSVLGIGGTGKTRLVMQLGRQQRGAWPGGVWFCDLSETRDVSEIASALAQTLGVRLGGEAPLERLGRALAAKGRSLVILDNVEQVVDGVAETVGGWLNEVADVCFLVTSRRRLGLAGEQRVYLEPLPPVDAAELFRVRARAVRGDVSFCDEEDQDALLRLMDLLDHLPLAIELAAVRMRVLSLSSLLSRMRDRFRLLADSGERPARHSTLRATLDWSWDLLSPWEQSALAQLSVFEGGFDLEDADAVVDLSAFSEAPWTMDVVQSLVEQSLVRVVDDDRFALLRSVQAYAASRLEEQGAVVTTEARHGEHFGELGTRDALDALLTHGGGARLLLLQRSLENLTKACQRAVVRQDERVAVHTLRASWEALKLVGPLARIEPLVRAVCQIPAMSEPGRLIALLVQGEYAQTTSRSSRPLAIYQEILELSRATGHRLGEAVALRSMGAVHQNRGALEDAQSCYRDALAIYECLGKAGDMGSIYGNLANVFHELGQIDEAIAHHEQALAAHRAGGNRIAEGIVLGNLGNVCMGQGRLPEARSYFERSLAIARELGNRHHEGLVTGNIGILLGHQGHLEEALGHLETALESHRSVGNQVWMRWVLWTISDLRRHQGRLEEAEDALAQAESSAMSLGDHSGLGMVLGLRGEIQASRGLLTEAEATLRKAVDHVDKHGTYFSSRFRSVLARLCARRGDQQGARQELELVEASLPGQGIMLEILYTRARGEVLWRAGDQAEAQRCLDHLLALVPGLELTSESPFQGEVAALAELLRGG